MKGKKWIAGLLALSSVMCFVGCNDGGDSAKLPSADIVKGMPDYSNATGVLDIDCWLAPSMSDSAYKDYADCGYNMLHLGNTSVHVEGENANFELLNESLDTHFSLAEKYGIKVILSMNARNSNQTNATPFAWIQSKLGKTLDKWKDSETFYGYMPYDEPRFTQELAAEYPDKMQRDYEWVSDFLLDEYLWWSQNYPGKAFEVVLLRAPNDGEKLRYGHYDNSKDPFQNDHDAYIDHYYNNVMKYIPYGERIWAMDAYAYGKQREEVYQRECYVESLAEFAYRAKKDNAEKWSYMQNHNSITGFPSVLQQYYTAMVFGYDHFVTYTYNNVASWGLEQASVDLNGLKTDNYYYYQKAHQEVRSFENVYKAFTDNWIGALGYRGTEAVNDKTSFRNADRLLDGYYRLDKVTCTQDTLIGVMRDADGYDGFLLSNQVVPTGNVRDTVEIIFNDANKAIVYMDGKAAEIKDLQDGKLTLELKTGGGAFVIPVLED